MKKYISICFIICLIVSTSVVIAEDTVNPVIWKYKTSSWAISTTTTYDKLYSSASSLDGLVYVFDKSGNLLWNRNINHRVVYLSFSEANSEISAVTGEKIYIYDEYGKFLSSYNSYKGNFMTLTNDGNFVAGSSSDVYVMLYNNKAIPQWDYKTGGKINSVSITSDGSTLASASSDNFVYLVKSGFLLWKYDAKAPVISVATTPDASYVVCGSGSFESKEGDAPKDFRVFLFDKEGKLLWDYKIGYTVSSVSITPDGSFIAVGSWDKKVHVFSKAGEHLKEFKTDGNVLSVSITPDGQNVVAGSTDTYVYYLNVASMSSPEKESSSSLVFFITPGIVLLLIALILGAWKMKKKK